MCTGTLERCVMRLMASQKYFDGLVVPEPCMVAIVTPPDTNDGSMATSIKELIGNFWSWFGDRRTNARTWRGDVEDVDANVLVWAERPSALGDCNLRGSYAVFFTHTIVKQ